MVAIESVGAVSEARQSGIRPFDLGRDLRAVAELIADAFSSELDPRGKAALREMRIMSHVSGLMKLVNRSTGEFNDLFSGFVWEEDGRIVGNVTVQRADRYGARWQIANVAVDPDFRGRGISRKLMQVALQHIESSRGQWAVLQVYERNHVARTLYDSFDFEDVGAMTDLRLTSIPDVDPPGKIPSFHSFASHQSAKLFDLANAQLNTQAQWWRSIRRTDFQITLDQIFAEWFWRQLGRTHIYRRAITSSRRFEAAIVLSAQAWSGEHKMDLWIRPQYYGVYEAPMVQWALATLGAFPKFPVVTKLSAEHTTGIQALVDLGFQPEQSLITMRKRIRE